MALVDHEQFSSMESKAGNMMTAEEERDHNKQRLQSMKLVLKELQQQLSVYKTRCSGVNTIAVMLQESKQEVVKLTKQRKALETAITNLQNRLSTNGLSSSVTIEETDMFVPGASKQTLDNLAKENARLRTLLKSHDGQVEKKSSEDIQKMAELIEKLEAENNHLRAQISQIDHWKVGLTNQFEDEMKQIKAEKLQLELDLNQQQETRVEVSNENKYNNNNETNLYKIVHSKSSQTFEIEPSKIDEVRQTLKILTDHCFVLDQSLETLQIPVKTEVNNETSATDKDNVVSTEAYLILKQKFNQVVQMNQHWQVYNENKDQQIHGLLAKITELEELSKKADEFRSALEVKEIENQNLRRDIASLTKEVTKFKSQPQFDISLVEILKQQIQVCTEDFNTERKDREHAVNKAKQLQEEMNRLSLENGLLKKENDDFQKKLKYSPEALNQRWNVPTQMLPQYFSRGVPSPPPRLPFSSGYSGSSQPSGHSLSPIPSPVPMSLSSTSSVSDRSSYYPPSHHDNVSGFQTPTRGSLKQVGQIGSQPSFPRARGPQENLPDSIDSPADMSVSMPALSVKTEDLSCNKQPDLTCPKCSKEFSDNQQSELINHINNCHE